MKIIPGTVVGKEWGVEEWLHNGDYCVKVLKIEPGYQCSLHFHRIKDEVFYVVSGEIRVQLDDETFTLRQGESVRVKPGYYHRFANHPKQPKAVVLESSTHHSDTDVVRLENSGPYSGW